MDHVIIYGRDGNITFDAIRWLIKHNVQITFLNWDGKLLTTMLPPESVQVKTKFAQYSSYNDNNLRIEIAKKLITAKFEKTQFLLDLLKSRYPQIQIDFSKEILLFNKSKSIQEIMMAEGRIASFYWQELAKIIPNNYEFLTREYQKKPRGAGDVINCLFNYGYSILEAECMRCINSAGLDVHIGFLHEANIGKNSLAYDLQEPFRFLIDLAIISIIEKNILEKSDFIRTENYNLRLRSSGAKKLLSEINSQFNKKVDYQGKSCSWSYVMLLKTRELVQFLLGQKKNIEFSNPSNKLERQDTDEMRKKIQDISYVGWQKMGFSKGSLFYLKKNAVSDKPFTMNKHVYKRLLNL